VTCAGGGFVTWAFSSTRGQAFADRSLIDVLSSFLRYFVLGSLFAIPTAALGITMLIRAEARSARYRAFFWYLVFGLIAATPAAAFAGGLNWYANWLVSNTYDLSRPSLWLGGIPALIAWSGGLVGAASAWLVRRTR